MDFNAIMLMDLHWGAISPEKMKKELQETLYKHLDETNEFIHMIAIGGDLFDSKQYLSSDVTKYVLEFLQDLLDLTAFMGTQIYIVKGTRTHDDLQLQTLRTIMNMTMNRVRNRVHIIEEVTEVRLVNIPMDNYDPTMIGQQQYYPLSQLGDDYQLEDSDTVIDILFIPEEYIFDQLFYYQDTLYDSSKHYDFIIGHGMVDKIWYARKEKDNMNELTIRSSSPVFKVDDLLSRANYAYFGHIHIHKAYGDGNRFQYVGPFTRWEFGTDSEVGYLEISYDTDTRIATEMYHKNTQAQRLFTRAISINETMNFTLLNDYLNNLIVNDMENCDKLRLIINLKSNIENALGMRSFIISKIGELNHVKLILTMVEGEQTEDDIAERDEKRKETLGYFVDSTLEEKIRDYIKAKKQVDIPIEDIKRILNKE